MGSRLGVPSDEHSSGEAPGRRVIGTGALTFGLVASLILALSFVRLAPSGQIDTGNDREEVSTEDGVSSDELLLPEQSDPNNPQAQRNTRNQGPGVDPAGLECRRGKNGGATDKGVSPTEIKLATTAVQDGEAKTLLENSITAMSVVFDKVNRAGGICGRRLELTVRNDSFRADFGHQFINNFIAEGYFALPVVPSAEGLGSAIQSGDIQRAGIPVVGTDGMRKEQYEAAGKATWVWPVAAATVSTMRIMAKYGYTAKGARSFGIVWDQKYKFGIEGAAAFREQVAALPGCAPPAGQGPERSPCIKADAPINPDDAAYTSQVSAFNTACSRTNTPDAREGCDMVAMLLLPDTAKKWLTPGPQLGRLFTSGAQTLFTNQFAQYCVEAMGDSCHRFTVWTGYNPPVGAIASSPGVAAYVSDLRGVSPSIDVNNQFTQGAYLGASVFVEALKKVGPNLTRDGLRRVMDEMEYSTDVSSKLSWRPRNHWANVRARAFSMVVSQRTFNDWADEGSGFVLDPAFEP